MSVIYSIPPKHVVLIKRFGKSSRVQTEGLGFRLPLIESTQKVLEWGEIANKKGFQIELCEQQTVTQRRHCHTLDQAVIDADASIYWSITDPVKAVCNTENLPELLANTGLSSLKATIAKFNLEQVIVDRIKINEEIESHLIESLENYGVAITRVEIYFKYNRIEVNQRWLNRSNLQTDKQQ